MKLFIKSILIGCFILSSIIWQVSTSMAGTHENIGTNGAQALEVELGVRPTGMGGTFCAVADDANAVYWNPAGLSQIEKKELNTSQLQHFEDVTCNYMAFIVPLDGVRASNIKDLGTLGFSMSVFDMGNFVGRDASGNAIGDFKCRDRIISVSYAKYLVNNFSIGANVKFLAEEIQDYKREAYIFDIGGLYNTPIENLNLGFCVQNLGKNIKLEQESESLPRNIKVGLAYKIFDENLMMAIDANKPANNFYRLNAGFEWWVANALALRAGYRSEYELGNGITGGAGLSIKDFDLSFMPVKEIVFDYAFIPYGDLGDTHQISLILKIGVD